MIQDRNEETANPGLTVLLKERNSQRETELALVREQVRSEQAQRFAGAKELVKLQEQLKYQQSLLDNQRNALEQDIADKTSRIAALDSSLLVHREKTAELRKNLAETTREYQAANELSLSQGKRNAQLDQAVAALESKLNTSEETLKKVRSEAAEIRVKLNEANLKYRSVTEQSALLKKQIAEQTQQLAAAQQSIQSEQAQRQARELELVTSQAALEDERQKYALVCGQTVALRTSIDAVDAELDTLRQVAQSERGERQAREQELVSLRDEFSRHQSEFTQQRSALELSIAEKENMLGRTLSELETLQALSRDAQLQSEQMKLQILQGKRQLSEVTAQAERLRQQKLAAENQITKTRATLSFQLGYLLIHGFKSFKSFKALPGQLVALNNESKRRKAGKDTEKEITAARVALPKSTKLPWSTVTSEKAPATLPLSRATLSSAVFPESADFAVALKRLKVACIMDEFTFGSYSRECNLLQLTPQYWQQELDKFTPELLIIESAWRGKDDLWGNKVGHKCDELVGIIDYCRERKVPTVFWNKEDPVHFETFLNTAKLFDYVFTTDIDCIHRYKGALGHDHVYLLPFACQPQTTNPLETYERKDAFCFAGAYYVRYPERTRDLGNFVSALAALRPVDIFDRNYGKSDSNYQFPPEYHHFIVGNLPYDQIDRAYKGYRYAINLNSIKQSQSMFARRIYDLLASNTLTVSNFSRGVRLLFGDLVITSDSGDEIVRKLGEIGNDESLQRKFTLAGLRKVMQEHTYQDRFAYIVAKVQGSTVPILLAPVVITAYAKNQEQFEALLASYARQSYTQCRLLVVVPGGFYPENVPSDDMILVLTNNEIEGVRISEVLAGNEYIAAMVPDDYYGPNYILDLVLATRYSTATVIGKVSHYVWSATAGLTVVKDGQQYRPATAVTARCSLAKASVVDELLLREWIISLYTRQIETGEILGIDEFNYCKNGNTSEFMANGVEAVNDLVGLNQGVSVEELIGRAERIPPAESTQDKAPTLTGAEFATYFNLPVNKKYKLTVDGTTCEVESSLADGMHDYLYSTIDINPAKFGYIGKLQFYLDVTPGLNLQMVVLFIDAQGQRISTIVKSANCNHEAELPAGTSTIRFGLRIYGTGSARINTLVLGHRTLQPALVFDRAEHLVLTNNYPAYDDLYRNAFVHSRVIAYRENGTRVDVFRMRCDEALTYHEFHDVDVITGSQEALHKLLSGGCYKSVLVHFLDTEMWQVLQQHIARIPVFVWVHGVEIQPYHRRDFNFETDQERDAAKIKSLARIDFWSLLLKPMHANLKLIFVSQYLADVVMEDLGIKIPENQCTVIHNAIDTDFFAYKEKAPQQRKKILSIRPYASRIYANDLSVQAILGLRNEPWFNELEIRMIGDGKLFDETLAPLRTLKNVFIEQRFLSRAEVATLHREYGIFLCPSRMDTQGVSRDEAMSSGLVPVSNRVAAIPEFVNESCGILADSEDAAGLSAGIAKLYTHPEQFMAMSKAAAERVRKQSSVELTIQRELELFRGKTLPDGKIVRTGGDSGEKSIFKSPHVVISTNQVHTPPLLRDDITHSFLSFDVEALPGRAAENDFERLVWGRAGGEEFGIRRICNILRRHQIKGNFMVDLSSARLYGDVAVQRVIDFLLCEGHEVHTHLHSEWVIRRWGLDKFGLDFAPFDQLDYDINRRLLDFSAWKYRQFTGKDGSVFRPGGFLFNRQTLLAAKDAGFTAISSFNRERHEAIFPLDRSHSLTEPFIWDNGLIELPVDLSPDPLSMAFETYLGAYDRVERKQNKTFNLVLHSWSLAKRDQYGHHPAFTPEHEERLHQICEHIKSVGTVSGYDEYLQKSRPLEQVSTELCWSLPKIIKTHDVVTCTICGAMVTQEILSDDICPGCGARARHRQLMDVVRTEGNLFTDKSVIACHANPMEKEAFLDKAESVFNFDVRPVSYVDKIMDIQDMSAITTGSFDCFFAMHVLNHVKDDELALTEIARVLKPDGFALLSVPYRENEPTTDCTDITEHYGADALEKYAVGTYRRYGKSDFIRLLERHFTVSEYEGMDAMSGHKAVIFYCKMPGILQ